MVPSAAIQPGLCTCCNHVILQAIWLLKGTTHTRLTALCPGLPGSAGTRKAKPIWILLKQETVRGSGISWAICKSAPCSRQITMLTPHHSVFYRPDALPAAQGEQQAGLHKLSSSFTNFLSIRTLHLKFPCGRLSWLMSAFERTLK